MKLNIDCLLNTVSQTALSYGEKLIGTIQKNKIVVVALLALGCLAAYLYKRNYSSQSAQLAAKTPQPINTDQIEAKTPVAKTQNVLLQAISQNENHREADPVADQENQEENKEPLPMLPSPPPSPLPIPKEKEAKILDEKKEKVTSPDPTPDPIEQDPVELQRKLKEQQDNRRKLISDFVKTGKSVSDLEQYIETTDDLIHLLNERCSFASAEAIRRNDPDYLYNEEFLNVLFKEKTEVSRRLEKKFNIILVEFAVRHVKERMSRMYLAHAFNRSHVYILDTSLTKDEIIDFLKDIDGSDLHKQYGAPFSNLRRYSSRFPNDVLDSIIPGIGAGGIHASNFKEIITKRVAIFKKCFADGVAKSDTNFERLFINCLKDHDLELLQALLDLGYQDPLQSLTTEEILQHLKDRSKTSTYSDYDRLKETINLLIKNNFLELETFGVQSSHDLMIKEFVPDHYVLLHMLESPRCDLQILIPLTRTYDCEYIPEFDHLMERAIVAIGNPNQFQNSLLACQFLHDHYLQLEDDMKKALAEVLQNPDYKSVKLRYFDDLGF